MLPRFYLRNPWVADHRDDRVLRMDHPEERWVPEKIMCPDASATCWRTIQENQKISRDGTRAAHFQHWLWSLTALSLFRETWSYGLSRRCWWSTHQFLTQYPRRENHWRRPADPTFGDRVITQIFRLLLFLGLSVIQQDVRRSVATNLKWSAGDLENSPDYAECWRVHVSSTRVIFMLDKSTPLCRR